MCWYSNDHILPILLRGFVALALTLVAAFQLGLPLSTLFFAALAPLPLIALALGYYAIKRRKNAGQSGEQ